MYLKDFLDAVINRLENAMKEKTTKVIAGFDPEQIVEIGVFNIDVEFQSGNTASFAIHFENEKEDGDFDVRIVGLHKKPILN